MLHLDDNYAILTEALVTFLDTLWGGFTNLGLLVIIKAGFTSHCAMSTERVVEKRPPAKKAKGNPYQRLSGREDREAADDPRCHFVDEWKLRGSTVSRLRSRSI